MSLVTKPDFNLIFASQAPSVDLPPQFNNYVRGMDETRKNNGKPTIKQFNYLHQNLDLKLLWILQNGAALPYDSSIEYAENSLSFKDGELQQFVDGVWLPFKKTVEASDVFDESGKTQQELNTNLSFKYSILHNSISQPLHKKLGERISVVDFGAVGDGVTDDRAAIQAAFDYLQDVPGGMLFFPATPFHYSIQSTHPDYPDHALVLKGNSSTAGSKSIQGLGTSSKIRLDTAVPITSLLYWPESIRYLTLDRLWFDANNKASYVLKADEVHSPLLNILATDFRNATDVCVSLSTFLANITRCNTFNGLTGFRMVGIAAGPVTSIVMDSCYALQSRDVGFDFGYATYCVLNACAVDGKTAQESQHTKIAYKFANAYGVTMNSCGCEQAQRLLYVQAYRGFVLNAPFMLHAGGAVDPVEYLVEFVSGTNATVSGIRVESEAAGGYEYILASTGAAFGRENITVTDDSVRRDQVYWVSNFSFDMPIKLLRGDQTERSRTVNIADEEALIKFMKTWLTQYEINHETVLQLADGTYSLSGVSRDISDLRGSGRLVIKGNSGDRGLVKLATGPDAINFNNISCPIQLENLTLTAAASTGFTRLAIVDCPFVYLDNVLIERGNMNTGGALQLTRSRVTLTRGSHAVGSFQGEVFRLDETSEVVLIQDSPPDTGSWTAGIRVKVPKPIAGGSTAYVCVTSGSPGVWKGAGAVED